MKKAAYRFDPGEWVYFLHGNEIHKRQVEGTKITISKSSRNGVTTISYRPSYSVEINKPDTLTGRRDAYWLSDTEAFQDIDSLVASLKASEVH